MPRLGVLPQTLTIQLAPGSSKWYPHAILHRWAGSGHALWHGGCIQRLVAVWRSQGARSQPSQQREDAEEPPQCPLLQQSTAQRGES